MKNNELSIVLPVFNEADVIENVIQEIDAYATRLAGDVEIIAVDDGSTDATLAILNKMKVSLPRLKVVGQKNEGYGGALRSGIRAAGKTWVLLMDSDGQFHIDALGGMWARRGDYDVLLGYRQQRMDGFYRRALGRLGNTVSNIFLRRSIRDINCGFKLFKRDLICSLPLASNGGIINFDILYRLFKNNRSLRLQQFSVKHYPRRLGKSTGGDPKVIGKIITEGFKILFK